jgi:hypothetical protein
MFRVKHFEAQLQGATESARRGQVKNSPARAGAQRPLQVFHKFLYASGAKVKFCLRSNARSGLALAQRLTERFA